jgi:hypothetical protein
LRFSDSAVVHRQIGNPALTKGWVRPHPHRSSYMRTACPSRCRPPQRPQPPREQAGKLQPSFPICYFGISSPFYLLPLPSERERKFAVKEEAAAGNASHDDFATGVPSTDPPHPQPT